MPLINPQIGIELLQFQGGIQQWYADPTRYGYDDFFNNAQNAELWINSVSGAGASVSTTAGVTDHPGIVTSTTGTTAAGGSMFSLAIASPPVFLQTGICEVRIMSQLPILSDGAQRYIYQCGLSDALVTGDVTNGVYFEYSDNINAGNWTLCAALAGVRTKVDSGIPAVAATYKELRITMQPSNLGANFYIDDAFIGAVATNIPVGVNLNLRPQHIKKSVGTTARTAVLDYVFYGYSFKPGR
jgi:hypothetical protein